MGRTPPSLALAHPSMTKTQSIRRFVAGLVRQSDGAYRLAKGFENRAERLRHSAAKLRPA